MFQEKCSYCDKIIEGYSKEQVSILMLQHKLGKHKDKFKIEELKNNNPIGKCKKSK